MNEKEERLILVDDLLSRAEQKFKLERIKESSIEQYLLIVRKISKMKNTREELLDWLNEVGNNRYNFIIIVLKKLISYGFIDEKLIEDIPHRHKTSPRVETAKELLKPQEIHDLIIHANTSKDKAIISILFECFPRISELLLTNRKDLRFSSRAAYLTIRESKTKKRTIKIVESLGLLKNYLLERGDHPGLLFVCPADTVSYPTHREKLTDSQRKSLINSFRKRLTRIVEKTNIEKRVYPHLFRISGVSYARKRGLKRESAEVLGGWEKGSKALSDSYLFLSQDDAYDDIDRIYGLEEESEQEKTTCKCPNCATVNSKEFERCQLCGAILRIDYSKSENELLTKIRESEELENAIRKIFVKMIEKEKEEQEPKEE